MKEKNHNESKREKQMKKKLIMTLRFDYVL